MFRAGRDQLVGETVDGKYELTRYIGAGSFAVVYEAAEVFAGQHVGRVAVKLIEPQEGDQQTGLVREIQALAQLSHAHVLTYRTSGVVQSGRLGGAFYIVTELAEYTLADALSKGNGSRLAQDVCLHVSSALAYLHSRNAVHRDVKPANILRVGDVWKLADFGLARGVSGTFATASGRKGTLGYMAPEMLDGQVGPASDVYALGVTLLECLTGRLAHEGSTEGEFLRNLLTKPAAIPGTLVEPWKKTLPRCLAQDASRRCVAAELMSLVWGPAPRVAEPGSGAATGNSAASGRKPREPEPVRAPRPAAVAAPAVTARPAPSPQRSRLGRGSRAGDELVGPDGGVYVWVPPGEFAMGFTTIFPTQLVNARERVLSRIRQIEHHPSVRVTQGFWIGKHEVTNGQFRLFCDTTRRQFPKKSDLGDDHPVVWVDWKTASAYCTHYGMRLPTEAQWEWAARGPESRDYPWGDDWVEGRCCCTGNRGVGGRTFPVGSFPNGVSWCGALDMAGNVSEWCADVLDRPRADSPRVDPVGHPATPEQAASRGGSWYARPRDCHAAEHDVTYAVAKASRGFRCVLVP